MSTNMPTPPSAPGSKPPSASSQGSDQGEKTETAADVQVSTFKNLQEGASNVFKTPNTPLNAQQASGTDSSGMKNVKVPQSTAKSSAPSADLGKAAQSAPAPGM